MSDLRKLSWPMRLLTAAAWLGAAFASGLAIMPRLDPALEILVTPAGYAMGIAGAAGALLGGNVAAPGLPRAAQAFLRAAVLLFAGLVLGSANIGLAPRGLDALLGIYVRAAGAVLALGVILKVAARRARGGG
ncbi:MAG TPA: hypothetical protein VHF22_15710 [Planctomycetota bacterium]|nr:hypothetical protein [Planctomycetota bacterium]